MFNFEKYSFPDEAESFDSYFSNEFSIIKIILHPFFKIKGVLEPQSASRLMNAVEWLKLKQAGDYVANSIEFEGKEFYMSNPDYPSFVEIWKDSEIVSWASLTESPAFSEFREIYIALATSIGSLSQKNSRLDLAESLSDYCKTRVVFQPAEGFFQPTFFPLLLNILQQINPSELHLRDHIDTYKLTLEMANTTPESLASVLDNSSVKNIYVPKQFLLSTEWDSFYTLFCTNSPELLKLVVESGLDVIPVNKSTKVGWYLN